MQATKEQIIKNYWNFHEDLYLTFPFSTSTSLGKHIAYHPVSHDSVKNVGGIVQALDQQPCLCHRHTEAGKRWRRFQERSYEVGSLITKAVANLPSLQKQNSKRKYVFYAVCYNPVRINVKVLLNRKVLTCELTFLSILLGSIVIEFKADWGKNKLGLGPWAVKSRT